MLRHKRTGQSLVLVVALIVAMLPVVTAVPLAGAAAGETYVVLYKQRAVPADAATRIARAGGTLVVSYDAIGVAVAESSSPTFAAALRTDARIEGVAASNKPVAKVDPLEAEAG